MKGKLEALGPPLVLSHNDLLSGNMMLLHDGTLQFIDFEYGGVNYRGFDLGAVFSVEVSLKSLLAAQGYLLSSALRLAISSP